MNLLQLFTILDDETFERLGQAKKLGVSHLPRPARRQAQERRLVELFECSVEKVVGALTEDELRRALMRVRFDSHEDNVGKLLDLPTASLRQLRRIARAVFIADARPYSNARHFLEAGDWPLQWVLRHSVVADAVILSPVGADQRGYLRGLFVSWLRQQARLTGGFSWPIARLVNLLGENRAESRLTLAAIERLSEVLSHSGLEVDPELTTFEKSPGIGAVVTIRVAPDVYEEEDDEFDQGEEDEDEDEGDDEDTDEVDDQDDEDEGQYDYDDDEDIEEAPDSDDEEDEPVVVTAPPHRPTSIPPNNATASTMTPHQLDSGARVDALPAPTTTLELCARRLKFILTAAASTRRLDAAALEIAIEAASGETRLSRVELARLRSLAHRYADGLEPIEATLTWLATSLDLTARHRLVHTARRLASPAPHAQELLDVLAAELLGEDDAGSTPDEVIVVGGASTTTEDGAGELHLVDDGRGPGQRVSIDDLFR